jgi:hypothetical protein
MKLMTKILTISSALLFLTATTVSASIPRTTQVSDNDTTAGYLNGKLVAGTGVSFTEGNDGGNETLTITATAATPAPTDATYITQTANGTLSAEQALSGLATGILKNTTTTGVLSIASAGSDYVVPAGNVATATALAANGSNCSAGSFAAGVDASGASEGCADVWTEAENTAAGYIAAAGVPAAETDATALAKFGTLTNTKWCTSNGTTVSCNEDAPAGSGDVTSVGDCTGGACLDGTSDGGTNIALYDSNSHKTTITAGDSIGDLAFTLPTTDGSDGEVLKTNGSGVLSWVAQGAFDATTIDAVTWSDGANASNAWTFDVSGTDHTMTAGNARMTFSQNVTVTGDLTVSGDDLFMGTNTSGAVLVADGTNYNPVVMGGDASIGTDGAVVVANDSHAHTTTTLSGIDIGDDTNLAAGRSLTMSGDSVEADAELYTDFKSMTIETPTDADNFFFFEAPFALTVTRVTGIVEAATSAVLTVQECDSAGDNCGTTESVTADVDGTISTSIDDGAIDAGDIIRLDVGTVTGTVGQAHLTLTYTKND